MLVHIHTSKSFKSNLLQTCTSFIIFALIFLRSLFRNTNENSTKANRSEHIKTVKLYEVIIVKCING